MARANTQCPFALMARAIVTPLLLLVCLSAAACSHGSVTNTVAGINVTVDSQKRVKEYRPPGSGTGFGQVPYLAAIPAREILIVELKSTKKIAFGDKGMKAHVKDDKGQTYDSIYSEVFGFGDEKTEAKILFDVPQGAAISTLLLDDVSFDLSKVKSTAND